MHWKLHCRYFVEQANLGRIFCSDLPKFAIDSIHCSCRSEEHHLGYRNIWRHCCGRVSLSLGSWQRENMNCSCQEGCHGELLLILAALIPQLATHSTASSSSVDESITVCLASSSTRMCGGFLLMAARKTCAAPVAIAAAAFAPPETFLSLLLSGSCSLSSCCLCFSLGRPLLFQSLE